MVEIVMTTLGVIGILFIILSVWLRFRNNFIHNYTSIIGNTFALMFFTSIANYTLMFITAMNIFLSLWNIWDKLEEEEEPIGLG